MWEIASRWKFWLQRSLKNMSITRTQTSLEEFWNKWQIQRKSRAMFYKSGETRPSVWSQYNSLLCEYRRAFPCVNSRCWILFGKWNNQPTGKKFVCVQAEKSPTTQCNLNQSKTKIIWTVFRIWTVREFKQITNQTDLQFPLRKFRFVSKRIHYGIVSFNSDCNQGDDRGDTSNPCHITTC